MSEAYFENEKTKKRYKIIRFDPAAGTVVLRGEHAEFVEKYSKEKFQELGYALVRG
jgi:glutamine amidotransferase-like uncharacterized protein